MRSRRMQAWLRMAEPLVRLVDGKRFVVAANIVADVAVGMKALERASPAETVHRGSSMGKQGTKRNASCLCSGEDLAGARARSNFRVVEYGHGLLRKRRHH
jgi:hypothetical protein